MIKENGWMLALLLCLVVLMALSARPARAETDGDMFDPAAWEALKDTEYAPMIVEYRKKQAEAAATKAVQAEKAVLPKKGFLVRKGEKLICLGDSITQAGNGYVDVLRNMITAAYPDRKIEVINSGISGNKVTDLLARVDKDVIEKKPDWLTLSIGINDVWHHENGVPLQQYMTKLDELVGKLVKANIRVVMLTTTVIGEDQNTEDNKKLVGYNVVIKEVARKYGLMVLPMNQVFTDAIAKGRKNDPEFKLTLDGVHPNSVGHTLMALTILKGLRFQEAE